MPAGPVRHAPRGTKDRAGQARLSLAELDAALGAFIVEVYNHRVHSETGQPPQARWEAGAFLPRLPESLEQLDLLLLTVAKPRKVHPDGIRFQGLRYLDPVLAAYVGESVIIRYDPRDLAEIRVFHRDRFLGRAVCPDLAATTVSLKQITAARSARRRELRRQIGERASVVDRLIAVHAPPPVGARLHRGHPSGGPADLTAKAQALPGGVTYMDTQDERADQLAALAEAALPATEPTGPEPPPGDADFIVTKEHRRFTEFATAVRRDRYIGLCFGPPGVGKTLSARRYACWHELEPLLREPHRHFTEGRERADWHTLLYTPTVSATPRMIDKELSQLSGAFITIRTPDPFDRRTHANAHALPPFVELLIIDEAVTANTPNCGPGAAPRPLRPRQPISA